MVAEYRKALLYGSNEQMKSALQNIQFIVRFLRRRSRYVTKAILPLFRIRAVAKVVLIIRGLLPSASRRALKLIT